MTPTGGLRTSEPVSGPKRTGEPQRQTPGSETGREDKTSPTTIFLPHKRRRVGQKLLRREKGGPGRSGPERGPLLRFVLKPLRVPGSLLGGRWGLPGVT